MVFVQIALQQHLGCSKRRHVCKIYSPHRQIQIGREGGGVKLSVAGHIVVPGLASTGAVHLLVGPKSVHIGIISIGRPGSPVIGMAIRINISAVRHRYPAHQYSMA